MVTLHNARMTVTLRPEGAELQAITAADGTEYLWNGDPAWWGGRAPILFPICGALRGGAYRYKGKGYTLPRHGFAKGETFSVESQSDTEAVFVLRDSDETRAVYPFAFELRVRYRLENDSLTVSFAVRNPADEPLYASIGSHEAYCCPEGLSAYDVVFEQEEPLEAYEVTAEGMAHRTTPVTAPGGVLPLRDDYFAVDALVFRHLRSQSVTLRNRTTGRGVKVAFGGAETFLIWTKPGAPYVCLEPWCGFPDWVDADGELTHKEGIRRIEAGETFCCRHTITIV